MLPASFELLHDIRHPGAHPGSLRGEQRQLLDQLNIPDHHQFGHLLLSLLGR